MPLSICQALARHCLPVVHILPGLCRQGAKGDPDYDYSKRLLDWSLLSLVLVPRRPRYAEGNPGDSGALGACGWFLGFYPLHHGAQALARRTVHPWYPREQQWFPPTSPSGQTIMWTTSQNIVEENHYTHNTNEDITIFISIHSDTRVHPYPQ
jgi:hypothetical protein